ncbi:MAG: hypothetical protein ACR2L1_01565 [Pyrinomonadaceae bacterium]
MTLKIFGDNKIEALWFKSLSSELKTAKVEMILSRGQNPPPIENIIKYDRPDIILTKDEIPVLVLEKTREVPTGHNVGQRFARIVRAAEQKIPAIKFFPFDARKHGEHTGICHLNIRMLKAFKNMSDIHNSPVIAVNWIIDEHGELIDNGTENVEISNIVDSYIKSGFDPNCEAIEQEFILNKLEYETRLEVRKSYAKLPNSARIIKTSEFINNFSHLLTNEKRNIIRKLDETLVYEMVMSPEKSKRQDPYTGTQFIYDYGWCRNGVKVNDKKRNLILYFPKINKETWYEKNPNNPNSKSSNWYLTATALLFSDGIDLIRDN